MIGVELTGRLAGPVDSDPFLFGLRLIVDGGIPEGRPVFTIGSGLDIRFFLILY